MNNTHEQQTQIYEQAKQAIQLAQKLLQSNLYTIYSKSLYIPYSIFTPSDTSNLMKCKMVNRNLCCYCNSALQCLKVAYPFIYNLFSSKVKDPPFICKLRKIMKALWYDKEANCEDIKKELGGDFAKPIMMDMYQCVSRIIECMTPDTKFMNFESKELKILQSDEDKQNERKSIIFEIQNNMYGKSYSNYFTSITYRIYQCETCKMQRRKLESTYAIQLIRYWGKEDKHDFDDFSLMHAIRDLFNKQPISMHCSHCATQTNHVTFLIPIILAPVLIFEFKNLETNTFYGMGKMKDSIMLTSNPKNCSEIDLTDIFSKDYRKDYAHIILQKSYMYTLVASGKHSGYSTASGHYKCFSFNKFENQWYSYNDSIVGVSTEKPFDHESIVLFFINTDVMKENNYSFDIKSYLGFDIN